jgi:rhodanese-related sulfurtransferase
MTQLPVAELSKWLADSQREAPLLLDVREPWEFALCRIEGSESVPLASLGSRLHRSIIRGRSSASATTARAVSMPGWRWSATDAATSTT